MEYAQPPNNHPRPYLMQKELTDFLNFPRGCTILGVQNVTLYCKIDTVIQSFRWIYKWSLAQILYKTLVSLFLLPIEPEISTPEISPLCIVRVPTYTHTHTHTQICIYIIWSQLRSPQKFSLRACGLKHTQYIYIYIFFGIPSVFGNGSSSYIDNFFFFTFERYQE